jgi:cytochrome c-type biogenesis protein CcmH/NrfG
LDRWRLGDEREFLVRSLDDAVAERGAGDMSEEDFAALTRRDRTRLDEVEAALALLSEDAGLPEDPDPDPERIGPSDAVDEGSRRRGRRRRWWLVGVGLVAMAAGLTLLAVRLASPRLPGQSSSGSVEQNAAQQITEELQQAATLTNTGTSAGEIEAQQIYGRILATDPAQPQALAEMGWLEWGTGAVSGKPKLVARGKAMEEASLRVEPDDYAAHLYLGTMLLKQGDASGAVTQYRKALAEGPPADVLDGAAPFIRQAFSSAGQSLPPGVPAG